jgi:hypothetical protein
VAHQDQTAFHLETAAEIHTKTERRKGSICKRRGLEPWETKSSIKALHTFLSPFFLLAKREHGNAAAGRSWEQEGKNEGKQEGKRFSRESMIQGTIPGDRLG